MKCIKSGVYGPDKTAGNVLQLVSHIGNVPIKAMSGLYNSRTGDEI